MSLYVRLQSSFWNHRKTLRLRAKIGDAAFWIPPRLWSYAAENQPDGDFTNYMPEELSMLLAYPGDAQAMLEAMQQAGFMDEMRIHDWQEHNAYHSTFSERAKVAAKARWDKENEKKMKRIEKKGLERKGKEPSIATSMLEAFPAAFVEEWENFRQHRRAIHHPMTPRAEELVLKTLRERVPSAIEAVQCAIKNNWRGFEWAWFDNQKCSRNGTHKKPSGAGLTKSQLDNLPVKVFSEEEE